MPLAFSQFFASKLVNNAAPDTLFTIAASPASNLLRNGRVRFANVTAGAVTIKAWAVPAAGAAADANVVLPTLSLAANSYVDLDLPLVGPGGFVQAQAGAVSSIAACSIDGFVQS